MSEELSTLFELLPIGAYRASPDGRLLHANAALVGMFGTSSQAELRHYFSDPVVSPYRRPTRRQEFLDLLWKQGYIVDFQSEMRALQGEFPLWVREHAHIVRDAAGAIMYYEGTIEDISAQRHAQEKLEQRENLLQNLLQTIPDRIWLKDTHGVYLTCNNAFAHNLGATQSQVVGTVDADWVTPEQAQAFAATDQIASRSGTSLTLEEGMPTPLSDDPGLWEIVKTPMHDAHGQLIGVLGMARNIRERKRAEALLRATQAELQATLGALPDLLIEFSAQGDYRAIHSHSDHNLAAAPEVLIGRRIDDMVAQEAADVTRSALAEAAQSGRSSGKQYSMELPTGKHWFELSVVRKPTEPGEEERFIAIARDITESKLSQEAIAHQAFHDSLTGLPNRRLMTERLQTAIAQSKRQQQFGAVMFLDLDRFKQLNDNHGHETGDLLLQEVARRLLHSVRAVDTVARLGGDEFIVLLQALGASPEDARVHTSAVAQKILTALGAPYALHGVAHTTTPSIGIALFWGEAHTHQEVIRQADTAMYQAKAQGRNTFAFFA